MLSHSLISLPFYFIFLYYFRKYSLCGISFSLILKIFLTSLLIHDLLCIYWYSFKAYFLTFLTLLLCPHPSFVIISLHPCYKHYLLCLLLWPGKWRGYKQLLPQGSVLGWCGTAAVDRAHPQSWMWQKHDRYVPTCGFVQGEADYVLTSGYSRGMVDHVPRWSMAGPCVCAINIRAEVWWATALPGALGCRAGNLSCLLHCFLQMSLRTA